MKAKIFESYQKIEEMLPKSFHYQNNPLGYIYSDPTKGTSKRSYLVYTCC